MVQTEWLKPALERVTTSAHQIEALRHLPPTHLSPSHRLRVRALSSHRYLPTSQPPAGQVKARRAPLPGLLYRPTCTSWVHLAFPSAPQARQRIFSG